MPETVFILTNIAHRGCKWCADCADRARTTASVTGSVGATHTDGAHTATVRRADAFPIPEERPDTDDTDLPRKFSIEFHNEAHDPTLRYRRELDDEASVKWYLNEMINWSLVESGESIVIRREVV